MKITLYEIHDNRIATKAHDIAGEATHYAFAKDEAETLELNAIEHNKIEPKSKYYHHEVEFIENELEIPDDYEITTAEQLMSDLFNGDVESPDYDSLSACCTKIKTQRITVID